MNQPTMTTTKSSDITFALILQISVITAFILLSISYFYTKRRHENRNDK